MDTYEKKIREYLNNSEVDELYKNMLLNLFPELSESEDEKVRKAIHIYLDWLDGRNKDYQPKGDYSIKDMIAWLEKQGMKKPADKVEPKFKVGDWIVDKSGLVQQVLDFRCGIYTCTYNSFTIDCESNYHLWTIQDAKDGDVLCLYYNNRKTFFIFKAIIGEGDYSDILVHCCYTGKYQYLEPSFNGECRMHQISDGGYCLPADKEEQGILFQKMKKAGYGWDAEKKELKKIEQKSQRMISAEAKEAMYDKPAWSEEDEKILNNIEQCIHDNVVNIGTVNKVRYIDWLKSLKERI